MQQFNIFSFSRLLKISLKSSLWFLFILVTIFTGIGSKGKYKMLWMLTEQEVRTFPHRDACSSDMNVGIIPVSHSREIFIQILLRLWTRTRKGNLTKGESSLLFSSLPVTGLQFIQRFSSALDAILEYGICLLEIAFGFIFLCPGNVQLCM